MPDRDTLRKHAGMVDRMATTLGIDLQEEALQGALSTDDISDAVLRCSECSNPEHCSRFLAQNAQSDHTPEYCRNQELFDRLMP